MGSEEHQYTVDSEGRIRPLDGDVWAPVTWASAPTFDAALAGAGALAISLARMENEPTWVGDLVVKQLLDIEDGASLVVGINTRRGRVPFSWGGEKFYPVRPDFGWLVIVTDFDVRPLNRYEGEIKASFSAHRGAASSLHRAIAAGELEPTSIKPFSWWEEFWGVRGIAIRRDGYAPPSQVSIAAPKRAKRRQRRGRSMAAIWHDGSVPAPHDEAIAPDAGVIHPGPGQHFRLVADDIAREILKDDKKRPPRRHGRMAELARMVHERLPQRGFPNYERNSVEKIIRPTLREWEGKNPGK